MTNDHFYNLLFATLFCEAKKMKTSYLLFTVVLIGSFHVGNAAWAEEIAPVDLSQHQTMTPQEYEAYRGRLQLQLEQTTPALQKEGEQSNATVQTAKPESGYGQGYRARAERNERTSRMNDRQGGAMSRRCGRNC
jgi:hypothetical protein